MKPKTKDNVYKAFIGEAKAYFRLLAYAQKADEEEVPQVAILFRAIAEAERVHATRQMNLVKDLIVEDTDTNLENSFQREKSVSENVYPDFLKDGGRRRRDHGCVGLQPRPGCGGLPRQTV
jgi:rubrerythrin